MPHHLVHAGKCAGDSVIHALQPRVAGLEIYHVHDADLRLADAFLTANDLAEALTDPKTRASEYPARKPRRPCYPCDP